MYKLWLYLTSTANPLFPEFLLLVSIPSVTIQVTQTWKHYFPLRSHFTLTYTLIISKSCPFLFRISSPSIPPSFTIAIIPIWPRISPPELLLYFCWIWIHYISLFLNASYLYIAGRFAFLKVEFSLFLAHRSLVSLAAEWSFISLFWHAHP